MHGPALRPQRCRPSSRAIEGSRWFFAFGHLSFLVVSSLCTGYRRCSSLVSSLVLSISWSELALLCTAGSRSFFAFGLSSSLFLLPCLSASALAAADWYSSLRFLSFFGCTAPWLCFPFIFSPFLFCTPP